MEYQTYTQEETSLGDLFSRLSEQASALIRQEIQLAQTEMTRKATKAGRDAAVIALGGLIALGAFFSVIAALILVLAQVMEAWLAALIVAVVLAIVAALLIQYGISKLKQIDPAPRRTIETMRENKEWLTQQI
ncbi:MAG: phage holin family protein [Candidatus Promineofilum sp.]|nr:phage holin family protein [Promineifilum sp.]